MSRWSRIDQSPKRVEGHPGHLAEGNQVRIGLDRLALQGNGVLNNASRAVLSATCNK
jgi:hypothetical protein